VIRPLPFGSRPPLLTPTLRRRIVATNSVSLGSLAPNAGSEGGVSMPLDLMTLSLVSQPVSLEEGVKILERDHYRCQYCGLDGLASFDNALAMSVDFVVPRARK